MDIKELLAFRQMITPTLIQVIFWVGAFFIAISALGAMFMQNFIGGLVMLIVGPLMWRVWCELVIVIFRINNHLAEMNSSLKAGQPPAAVPTVGE